MSRGRIAICLTIGLSGLLSAALWAAKLVGPWTDAEGRLLALLAISAGVNALLSAAAVYVLLRAPGLEAQRQNEALRLLATKDDLTSCLNRRSFAERMETHWKAAQRYGFPLSLLMLDVDRFKSVNDRQGHSMGDEVLRRVAAALNHGVRDSDLVCRYGGDEFCVLWPYLDLEGACQAAERYRKEIESLAFPNVTITASLGVSSTTLGACSIEELLDQADVALYAAKRNGRNQVARWDQRPRPVESPSDLGSGYCEPETVDFATAAAGG